jgi:Ribonuclease G/E
MQAELVELEKLLKIQEERDAKDTDGKRSRYAGEFNYLLLSHKHGDITQLELVKNIQVKLEAYSRLKECAQAAKQC